VVGVSPHLSYHHVFSIFCSGNRAAELEARRLKRQRLADNSDDDNDAAVAALLADRQAQKKTRGGKTAAPKVKKAYVPEKNSGSYALLVGLLLRLPEHLQQPLLPLNTDSQEAQDIRDDHITQHLLRCQLAKSDLMSAASDHCRVSMFTSENGGFHTGWNSMKTLATKELVLRKGNPPRFHLTMEGYKCAVSVWQAANADAGLPSVAVPIEAMGGVDFAGAGMNAQAGPGPRTAAASSRATTGGATASGSAARSKETAYVPVIDEMDFMDDFPPMDDFRLSQDVVPVASTSRRGPRLGEDENVGFAGAEAPTMASRTVEGLQFWYIGELVDTAVENTRLRLLGRLIRTARQVQARSRTTARLGRPQRAHGPSGNPSKRPRTPCGAQLPEMDPVDRAAVYWIYSRGHGAIGVRGDRRSEYVCARASQPGPSASRGRKGSGSGQATNSFHGFFSASRAAQFSIKRRPLETPAAVQQCTRRIARR
jgi:hypothetical protein